MVDAHEKATWRHVAAAPPPPTPRPMRGPMLMFSFSISLLLFFICFVLSMVENLSISYLYVILVGIGDLGLGLVLKGGISWWCLVWFWLVAMVVVVATGLGLTQQWVLMGLVCHDLWQLWVVI